MREGNKRIVKRYDRQLDTTTEIVLPVIHMNGTSRTTLLLERDRAIEALRAVKEALGDVTVNGRDFYPLGPELMQRAEEQHRARILVIHNLLSDLEYEYAGIQDDDFDGD